MLIMNVAIELPKEIAKNLAGPDEDLSRIALEAVAFCGFTLVSFAVAVSALRPDVAIVHAQRADRSGNVQIWGIPGVQKEAVLAARHDVPFYVAAPISTVHSPLSR